MLSVWLKVKQVIIWLLWILLVQFVLANISASIYAYKFTHLYSNPPPYNPSKNLLQKTWKLFVGPRNYKTAADTAPPLSYSKVGFKTDNNLTIEGWYSGSDTTSRCVIFFHGITVSKDALFNEASMFKAWGYNVLLIDFRAHGNSEGEKTSLGYKETEEVEKAFKFAQSKGNSKILLYGVSMGAAVVIKAVGENKVHPSAIIADMPFGSLKDHLKARARVLGFPSQPFASLVTFWIGLQSGYNGFSYQTDKFAKKINCPVLVQWGDRDEYVTKEEITNVYQAIPSGNKTLAVYQNVNHNSFLNEDPEAWQKNVKAFLGGRRGW